MFSGLYMNQLVLSVHLCTKYAKLLAPLAIDLCHFFFKHILLRNYVSDFDEI